MIMTIQVLFDDQAIAIDATQETPADNERGLQFGQSTYSGLSLATASIVRLASVPADFVGLKYRLNATADGLEPNPAYVVPVAPPTEAVPAAKEWPALDFYNKFSPGQRIAIRTAAKTDPVADDLVRTLELYIADRRMVRDDGGSLTQGLAHLVSTGVLTQAEVDALVA